MSQSNENVGNILIVDDKQNDLNILTRILTTQGYEVCPVRNGRMALQTVQETLPDLILLDIMLPGMNGYEICQQLKRDKVTRDVPVLFISALDETPDKVKAFEVGGVDYITKPFRYEEVLSRVATHLNLRNMQKRLQEQNTRLQKEIAERKQAEKLLRESEKRYRSIFENATIGIFQATLKGSFMTVNPEMARMLGYDSVTELVETVTHIAEQLCVDSQDWYATADMLQITDEPMKIETQCCCKDGGKIITNLNVWSVRDEDGTVRYFEGFIENITEQRQAEKAVARREAYLATLVEIQLKLLEFEGDELPYNEILSLLGQASHTSRVCVFENHRDSDGRLVASQWAEWCAEGIQSEIDNPALQNLSYTEVLSRWYEVLSRGKIIAGVVTDFPEQEREMLTPYGIRSILVLPLTISGKFSGFIGFEDCLAARIWSPSEVSLLQAAAAAISLAKK